MIKRPFSKSLYDTYDSPARTALKTHLVNNGHSIVQNKEDYNVDVVSEKDGIRYYNEAEVKTAWDGTWPTHWAEIRIPERKVRLLSMYEQGYLNFYIFRKDFKQVFRIKDSSLRPEVLREARGRWIVDGEKFFHIPYHEAKLINL